MPLAHKRSGLIVEAFLTHEQLFGWRSSPNEFNAELLRFPSDLLLSICSALNMLLFGWSAYLDKDIHDRLVQALCPSALDAIKRGPFVTLFHRQMLLLVAKEALRRGPYASPQPTSRPDMTRLFTMANDQLAAVESPSPEQARTTIELISRFLSVSEFQYYQPTIRLARAYVMLANLRNLIPPEGKQFDIPHMFEQTTGLPPSIYFPLVMAIMSKYAKPNIELFQSPGDFGVRLEWFSRTSVHETKLQRFFVDLSGDYSDFKQLLGQFDKGVSDFTVFRERPVLRLKEAFYPIDFAFLAAKSESAFFWRAQSSLPSGQRETFHAFWGAIFERYMHRLLKQSVDGSINRYYESPKYADRENEEVCDGIILCKGCAVLIEFKGSMFRADAKWGTDFTLLEREIRIKLVGEEGGSRKGVTQLATAISNVFGPQQRPVDINLKSISKVYSVLVTYDDIGDAWFLASYLNEAFKKAINRKKMSATVTPMFCMSGDHFEALASTLSNVALSDILEARYKQERELKMPFWLPNNPALKGLKLVPPATIEEGFEELKREASRLFPNAAQQN
jgi:hypothetical protein